LLLYSLFALEELAEITEERNRAVLALNIIFLKLLALAHAHSFLIPEFRKRIEIGRALLIFFREPDLVAAEKTALQEIGVVGGEDELGMEVSIIGN